MFPGMFPRRRHHGHHRGYQRQSGFALYLLAAQLLQVGLDRIPPVTLFSILGQVAIFLRLIPRKGAWPPIRDICISSQNIIYKHDFKRLIMAPFFHLDDWHIYYNMVSYLWKGMHLEKEMGSVYFAYLIAVFSVLSSGLTAGLGVAAAELSGDPHYAHQCAAGFSGVIFALKVLTTYNSPRTQLVMGIIPVPGPWICWAELVLIQVISPNVSFIGHLAGILIGLLYVKGPLKSIMDSVIPPQPSYTYSRGSSTTYGSAGPQRPQSPTTGRSQGSFWPFSDAATGYRRQPSYTYTSGTTTNTGYGHDARSDQGTQRPHYQDHHAYTGGLTEEEQMRRAMEESRRSNVPKSRPQPSAPQPSAPTLPPDTAPPSYEEVTRDRRNNLYPDLPQNDVDVDAVRRRRLARFT